MVRKGSPYFENVDLHQDFAKEEEQTLKDWYEKGIVEKYLNKNKKSEKFFSFLDGPITANNPMGVHHAWGRTYKDLWQRFYNMRGFRQRFQNGFDCQGLWVEVEVEKELGFKSKKDIEKYGISEFIQKCRERVEKYSEIQTKQTIRLGNFMDWDHSYYTMSDENNYMIWHFLKVCHEKKLIYKGKDVVPWCYRCETAISEHEILTEDYKEVKHTSIFLRLPIIGRDNEFLLVWTTTPWTIPANISVAVDEKRTYCLVQKDDKKYWIMESLREKVFAENEKVLKSLKGSELVGLKYTAPFDDLQAIKAYKDTRGFHEVVATDPMIMPITEDEGTGLVHTSTGTGAEDHKLGKKLGLPVIPAINDSAEYLADFGSLTGINAKENPQVIIDFLQTNNNGFYLFKTQEYLHRYPACWRCKSELVWKLADEWYIAIDPVREDMKRVTRKIKWIPHFGLKRELDWLNNMHDWLISKKNRYWGLALPIWECECGNFEVIGSREELKEKAVDGWDKFDGHTPHKPYIDLVSIKCPKCGKLMRRIPDVGNPWLDAGIVPFSTISSDNSGNLLYKNDKKDFENWFPADFITESFPGQFKNWFYSVLAMSTILENREPYKTVLGFATLLAEDGRPMHKSWGNSIEFNEAAGKIGADVMRWMYLSSNPSDNMLFGYKIADDVRRRFYLKLWNVVNFFVSYANIDGWSPNKDESIPNVSEPLDRWIIERYSETLDITTVSLIEYKPNVATSSIEKFIDDLSNWYIRRSRDRVGPSANDEKSKTGFYETAYFILLNLSKMLAPFTPFISDAIYKNLTKRESVHLDNWPVDMITKSEDLIKDMENIRSVVEIVHAQRKAKGIAVRVPLSKLDSVVDFEIPDERLYKYLLEELNVKTWKVKKGKKPSHLPDFIITPELQDEADTRDLIRKIQNMRKDLNIMLDEKINVVSDWLPANKNNLDWLTTKIIAKSIKKGDTLTVEKA
ncbi:MAG TPA: isoleucine--tRNA ligase [Patescibacteria group bacterium]|nr:isoleucine--tRNA ligase [Patescibacteria group bacterium]